MTSPDSSSHCDNLFDKINLPQPKLYQEITLRENIDTSRIVEMFNPKYNLTNEQTEKLQKYLHHKVSCINDKYSQKSVGRMYCSTSSQMITSEIRNTLFLNCFDLDMVASSPNIVSCINEKLNYECPRLQHYINNRKKILNDLAKKYNLQQWEVKQCFNSLLNGQSYKNSIVQDPYVEAFYNECKCWRYQWGGLLDGVYEKGEWNDVVAKCIYDLENRCLMSAFEYLQKINITVRTLVFDGMIIEGDENGELTEFLPDELNKFVSEEVGLKIQFALKPMTDRLFNVLPQQKEFDYEIFKSFKTFPSAKAYFEEFWALIDAPYCLLNKINSSSRAFNLSQFKNNFNLQIEKEIEDPKKGKKMKRFHFWDIYKTEATKYEFMDFLPPPLKVPKYTYNLFNGLQIEKTLDSAAVAGFTTGIYHEHLKHLVNYDEKCYKYVYDYLADIVQNTGKKQNVCLVFRGGQGGGKNLFFECFGDHILGLQYRLTAEKIDQVLGRFNANHNRLLVICDEMNIKKGNADEIKTLITSEYNYFEKKCVDGVNIKNLARYIMLSNNEIPIKIEQGDRRFCVFETSTKYSTTTTSAYFKKLIEAMTNPHKMRVFYDELMNHTITTDFEFDRPIHTDAYNLIKSCTSTDTIDDYFTQYAENPFCETTYSNKDWFIKYVEWVEQFSGIGKNTMSQKVFMQKSLARKLLQHDKIVKGYKHSKLGITPMPLIDDDSPDNSTHDDEQNIKQYFKNNDF